MAETPASAPASTLEAEIVGRREGLRAASLSRPLRTNASIWEQKLLQFLQESTWLVLLNHNFPPVRKLQLEKFFKEKQKIQFAIL